MGENKQLSLVEGFQLVKVEGRKRYSHHWAIIRLAGGTKIHSGC